MTMQSVSLVFPNGYIANAGGPITIESEQWTAWNNPEGRSKAAIILAPILGIGLGTGIGAATDHTHTFTLGGGSMPSGGFGVVPGPMQPVPGLTVTQNSHKGLMIGSAVGGAVGMITSFALIARNHQFYIEEGSPMTMSLPQPVTLTKAQIDEANQKAAEQPALIPATRSRPPRVPGATDNGTCYTPGAPGRPDIVVPGSTGVNDLPERAHGNPGDIADAADAVLVLINR
jgi:hypothetical protein